MTKERADMRRQGSIGRVASRLGLLLAVIAMTVWVLAPVVTVLVGAGSGDGIISNIVGVFDQDAMNAKGRILVPAIINTLVVATVLVVINLVLATVCAYGISRYPYRGSRILYTGVLVSRVVPAIAIVGPFFIAFRVLGVLSTPWALIISYNVFTLPLAMMTLKNYFDQLPVEIEEAAFVDGAGPWRTFLVITAPLARPGLVATGVLVFMEAWSEFFYSLVLTNQLTITPALAAFQSAQNFDWPGLAAATLVTMVPPVALALVFQRHIVGALAAGYDR